MVYGREMTPPPGDVRTVRVAVPPPPVDDVVAVRVAESDVTPETVHPRPDESV